MNDFDPLIKDFAGDGCREARIKIEQYGENSIRKSVVSDGDGLLMTKNGMPRIIPLWPAIPCADTVSPLTENGASSREFWPQEVERRYSTDGLLSLPLGATKTIKVLSGAPVRTLYLRLANGAESSVKRPGDLCETSRETLSDPDRLPAWYAEGVLFLSESCITSITFQRGACPVSLNFDTTLRAPSGEHGPVYGEYDMTAPKVLPVGSGTVEFLSGDNRKLSLMFAAGQPFLEPFLSTVLQKLRDGEVIPEWESSTAPGAYFSMDRFGSPFKCFANSSGLFTDSTRSVRVDTPSAETVSVAADENTPARYFHFVTGADVPIRGTNCALKSDVQFNGGISYPGPNPVTLGGSEHLYKDATGAVWRVVFSYETVSPTSVSVEAKVTGRVDCFLDPVETQSVVLNTKAFSPINPANYFTPEGFASMLVDSLPNGKEASVAINSPEILKQNGDTIPPETVIILKCIFSGDGGDTGAGISVVFEQVPTVVTYVETNDVQPGVVGEIPSAVVTNEAPSLSCARQFMQTNQLGEKTGWVEEIPVSITPTDTRNCYGSMAIQLNPPSLISGIEEPYNYLSKATTITVANIQLVARANNTWDMLKMEYQYSLKQERSDHLTNDSTIDFVYYCAGMTADWFDLEWNRGSWPFVRCEARQSGGQSRKIEVFHEHRITYSCGDNSISGYVEYISDSSTRESNWSGEYAYDPAIEKHPSVNTSTVTTTTSGKSSLKTPFCSGEYGWTRVESQTKGTSGGVGFSDYNDSGVQYYGDSAGVQWARITPLHSAKNKHSVEYDFEKFQPPRVTRDDLIHGVAITRPIAGVVVCDDPRNTRLVPLSTDNAGLFF